MLHVCMTVWVNKQHKHMHQGIQLTLPTMALLFLGDWVTFNNTRYRPWTVGSSFQKICLLFVLKGLPLWVSLWRKGTSETCRRQSSSQLPVSISYLQTTEMKIIGNRVKERELPSHCYSLGGIFHRQYRTSRVPIQMESKHNHSGITVNTNHLPFPLMVNKEVI